MIGLAYNPSLWGGLLGQSGRRAVLGAYPASANGIISAARRLSLAITSPYTVHRSSDSATMAATYLPNGYVNVAALRAFRGNSTLWIDSVAAGNGNTLTTLTASTVELVLDGIGGLPSFAFYGNGGLSCAYNSAFAMAGDQSIVVAGAHTSTNGYFVGTLDGSNNGWAVKADTLGKLGYFSKTKGAFSDATTATIDGYQRSYIVTRTSGALAHFLQNTADGTATGHGNIASNAALFVGGDTGGLGKLFGLVSEIAFYDRALTAGEKSAINADHVATFGVANPANATVAFKGGSGLRFIASSYVNAGANLLYERTQPFTVLAAIKVSGRPAIARDNGAALIFCNVGTAPYPGYELWLDWTGNLRVRLINDAPGAKWIDVVGSIPLVDNNWHVVGLTYAGNSLAAGVKLFVDGTKDPGARILADNLIGSMIGTSIRLGNQAGFESAYYHRGALDEIQIHSVERDEAYMAAHMTAGAYPALPDANIAAYWKLDDGSGTSAADAATGGFTGTLTGSPVWLSAAP